MSNFEQFANILPSKAEANAGAREFPGYFRGIKHRPCRAPHRGNTALGPAASAEAASCDRKAGMLFAI
jgi:hypothetical protein